MKVAVMTDSNSGLTQNDGKKLGITIVPMPFMIDGEEFFEDINLTQEMFYDKLTNDADVSTSQPAIGVIMSTWDDLLENYDQIVYLPMSSALSKSCESAKMLAESDYKGKVFVIDNRRISVTLKSSVYDAIALAEKGLSGEEIQTILENDGANSSIYIMVDTLKYLKKGGRISASAAALGSALHIKPVLSIDGGLLEPLGKVIGTKKGRAFMISEFKNKIKMVYNNDLSNVEVYVAYTQDLEKALDFKYQIEQELGVKIVCVDPLSLSVSTHIGPGALALASAKIVK